MDSGDGVLGCEPVFATLGGARRRNPEDQPEEELLYRPIMHLTTQIKTNFNQTARVSSGFMRLPFMKTVMNTQVF